MSSNKEVMVKYIVIFQILMLGCSILQAQESINKQLFPKIDSILNTYYDSSKPGGIISVLKDGELVYTKGVGLANLEYNIPISDSTAFHIASVSKQFTAFLAVLLEEEGKLNLDDDIREYLLELKHLPHKITLRQLANHTHGLPNLFELAQLKGISSQEKMTHEEIVDMLLSIKSVNFKAGDQYEYNNTGYALLAEIIERVAGETFGMLMQEKVFKPLGMNSSRVIDDPSKIVKNKAYSYQIAGDEYLKFPIALMANGSSGISTSINDLNRWIGNFYKPVIGSKATYQKMIEFNTLNSGEVIQYGLGLESKKYKGLDVIFHGGGDAAYRSYLIHEPQSGFAVSILSNSGGFSSLDIIYAVFDLCLEEQLIVEEVQKVKYSNQELQSFVGTYKMFPGTFYNILAEEDTLFFQSFGASDKAALPNISEKTFEFPYIPHSKFVFYEGGFNFYIADFKYPCEKVELEIPENIELDKFVGRYRNKELKVTYELLVKDEVLWAVSDVNSDIRLFPLSASSFYSNVHYFGKIEFVKDESKAISGFLLGGNFLKNIEFVKIQ